MPSLASEILLDLEREFTKGVTVAGLVDWLGATEAAVSDACHQLVKWGSAEWRGDKVHRRYRPISLHGGRMLRQAAIAGRVHASHHSQVAKRLAESGLLRLVEGSWYAITDQGLAAIEQAA